MVVNKMQQKVYKSLSVLIAPAISSSADSQMWCLLLKSLDAIPKVFSAQSIQERFTMVYSGGFRTQVPVEMGQEILMLVVLDLVEA